MTHRTPQRVSTRAATVMRDLWCDENGINRHEDDIPRRLVRCSTGLGIAKGLKDDKNYTERERERYLRLHLWKRKFTHGNINFSSHKCQLYVSPRNFQIVSLGAVKITALTRDAISVTCVWQQFFLVRASVNIPCLFCTITREWK